MTTEHSELEHLVQSPEEAPLDASQNNGHVAASLVSEATGERAGKKDNDELPQVIEDANKEKDDIADAKKEKDEMLANENQNPSRSFPEAQWREQEMIDAAGDTESQVQKVIQEMWAVELLSYPQHLQEIAPPTPSASFIKQSYDAARKKSYEKSKNHLQEIQLYLLQQCEKTSQSLTSREASRARLESCGTTS